VRAVGNLARLREAAGRRSSSATVGLGHTRWATHGRVTEENAHPHLDATGQVAVVMNGIVENYRALRAELSADGVVLRSETDAEVIPHLIARSYRGDLVEAVQRAVERLDGHFAFIAAHAEEPFRLVGARRECPLVVGVGDGERFLASAVPAFLSETRRVIEVESGEVVAVEATQTRIWGAGGSRTRAPVRIEWDHGAVERCGYESFMLKEIHEQGSALRDTLADRLRPDGRVDLPEIPLGAPALARLRRVQIVACGTSHHAGLAGRHLIEEWAGVPVAVEVASEYRYRAPLVGPGDLVIGITQSGETADTLAAMRLARERGARVLALTNAPGSQATRDADGALLTRAGIEIGVAATKTHTAQIVALALIALRIGRLNGGLDPGHAAALATELLGLPGLVDRYLASPAARAVGAVARRYAEERFFLFLGRHVGVGVAHEGGLKLKEITYIPTEAYPAGEMKHGPIALISEGTPVVVVATDGPVLEKVLSNVEEARARGARVIAVATEGNREIAAHADDVLPVPASLDLLSPVLAVLPLQLLAHGVARQRGLNVDQPRNLAKTVTVE
jgi:glucosamine--fructose-6-phosphate aminotransferase (isomerizing)